MRLQTKIFELCNGRYANLSELAQVMGISASQIYRVKQGKHRINEKFIIGTIMAFPSHRLDELFYLKSASLSENTKETTASTRHKYIVQQYNRLCSVRQEVKD